MLRRRDAFLTRRPTTWSILVPVVALAAGVLFATSSSVAQGTSLRSAATGIPDLIRSQTLANERRAAEVDRLQGEVDELTRAQAPFTADVTRLGAEADALAVDAGRVPAQGPTLTVSLDDSPLASDEVPEGFTVDDIVVHQQDVQAVVNAMWAGGAEAMMLQDQRVISTSAVRCVGNTLILQGRVYSPPYVVRAIGPVPDMRAAVASSPEVAIYQQYVEAVGLGYEVSSSAKETFPAYSGSITPEFARVMRP
ncbi:MAG TPA: DUF881 domain-containing protein [Dermatophilaceae bacterium]|nr:DUF881 domain-containing protein [Dermatophilaceae bacterium]